MRWVIMASWVVAIVTGTAFVAAQLNGQPRGGSTDITLGKKSGKPSPRDAPIPIEVFEYGFNPSKTVIKAGQAIVLRGVGKELHDVIPTTEAGQQYFDEAEEFGSSRPIFKDPGVYPIVCSIHPNMKGKIVVVKDF